MNQRVTAVLHRLSFLMANPVIREFSPFCKGLGNMDEGISHGKVAESKVRDNIARKVYRPGPDMLGKLSA